MPAVGQGVLLHIVTGLLAWNSREHLLPPWPFQRRT